MRDAESDAQHVATGPAPPDASTFSRVAIAHDYLNQFGGAERVVLELADMWPSAPIYTPARWLYGGEYMSASLRQRALAPLADGLRRWDRRAAARPDLYIAISASVQERIRRVYGREAPVVYPPVDLDRFTPRPRGERLLVVSRLLPYKRVDAVVAAATRTDIGLDVVGTGPALSHLRHRRAHRRLPRPPARRAGHRADGGLSRPVPPGLGGLRHHADRGPAGGQARRGLRLRRGA